MKFRCERDVLAEALGTAGRAAAVRAGSLPVLSGIRLELQGDRLLVTGTDLELSIQVEITVAGERDGVAVLPARLSSDIVRALEGGAVLVDADDDDVRISAGRTQFSVRAFPAEEFPRLTEPALQEVTLPARDFGDALRRVVRAASSDDSRPILTGVLLAAEEGGLRLVATDSYRLAVCDLRGTQALGPDQKVLVPSRALNELGRVLSTSGDLVLRLGEREATFQAGPVRVSTRLIEGEFPNYRQLIPQGYPNRLTVGREPLLDAIRRMKLVAAGTGSSPNIRLQQRASELELTAIDPDKGQASESIDAKLEGEEMTVAFNPDFLASGVDAVAGDEVVIETLDALKPALVRSPEHADYLYLLMPVRVP